MSTANTPAAAATSKKKNFFELIASGFEWIGKEAEKAATWFPKIFKIVDDVDEEIPGLATDASLLIDDVGELASSAVKDSGSAITAASGLVAAIVNAAKGDGINIASDEAVVTAFETFIQEVTTKSNYQDVIKAEQKLVADYDALGAKVKATLAQLKADA